MKDIVIKRDPRFDPIAGDIVEHPDGGTMYVRGRRPKTVNISRRPDFADERDCWMRLSTFRRLAERDYDWNI